MPLTANFLADFSSFVDACANATTSTDELVESAGKVGAAMDQAVQQAAENVKSVGAGLADFGKKVWSVLDSSQMKQFAGDVTSFVSGYVNEFAEAEAATAKLGVALKNAGTPEAAAAYGDMATALQKVSTFSDEALMGAQTLFTTVGKIGPESMEATLKATMDLATGMGVDLATAANLVAKAASSDGEALGKLKVILGDSVPKGADFARVMEEINKKFGGQSLAALETTAGQMENMKNQMSDINEVIGEALVDNLRILFDWFKALPEGMQTFIIGAVALGTALAPVLVSLSSLIGLLSSAGLGAGIVAAFEAILPFLGPIGWIAAGLIAMYEVWKHWDDIVAFVKKAIDSIVGFLTVTLPKAFYAVIDVVKNWYAAMKYWLWDQLTGLVNYVVGLPGKIAAAFATMADQIAFNSYVPDMVDIIAHEFGRLDRIMVAPAMSAVDDVVAGFAALGEPMISPTLNASATGRAGSSGGGPVSVVVNMSGMLGTDDPQTRAMVNDVVSRAVMQGMRGSRLLGTA